MIKSDKEVKRTEISNMIRSNDIRFISKWLAMVIVPYHHSTYESQQGYVDKVSD